MVNNCKEHNMLVQIAISGQYAENYAAQDWDGEGAVPQGWKQKWAHDELMVCNVPAEALADVVAEMQERMAGMSWSDDFSRCYFDTVKVLPNKLSQGEFVEWNYSAYEEITSISLVEIKRFLEAFPQ
jgi:hypothetical protein